jgi:hypothetical protein
MKKILSIGIMMFAFTFANAQSTTNEEKVAKVEVKEKALTITVDKPYSFELTEVDYNRYGETLKALEQKAVYITDPIKLFE